MQYGTMLSAGVLALACLACVVAIGKARKGYGEGDQTALYCAQIGFALSAAAAATELMYFDPSWQAAHLWLSQASKFLGLPLLGAAALALGRGWTWSRPNWGRILLGLCAFFELFRQMNMLDDYRLALHLATLALLLYAGAVQWPRRTPLTAAVGVVALLLGAGLAVDTEGFIGPLRRLDLFYLLLTPAYPLLAWLLLTLPGGATESHSPQAA
jgi:hypothetical protein